MSYWPGAGSGRALGIEEKADKSLVSKADYASNEVLVGGLSRLFPDIPIKSEESNSTKALSGDYWLIDPLDGTSRFLDGADDFAILVAYIGTDGIPEAGWIVFPAQKVWFWAIGAEFGVEGLQEKEAIGLSQAVELRPGSVYVRARTPSEELVKLDPRVNVESLHSGAAFFHFLLGKLSGVALFMGRLGPWDIAAPAAVIHALGGATYNQLGEPYRFGEIDEEVFVAVPKQLRVELISLVGQLFKDADE